MLGRPTILITPNATGVQYEAASKRSDCHVCRVEWLQGKKIMQSDMQLRAVIQIKI